MPITPIIPITLITKKKKLTKTISLIIVTAILLIIIRIGDLKLVKISGHSMYPTLIENDFVLSTRYTDVARS